MENNDSSPERRVESSTPGIMLGLRKVKRFFDLNKKDGALSSSDHQIKSHGTGTDSELLLFQD